MTITPDRFPTPAALAARPHCPRRRIPVPWVNEHEQDDGTTKINFISINHDRAIRCSTERLCGACGEPLDYWVAFLGSPRTPDRMRFTDPPTHEDCALAALVLCPHIAIRRHTRAPEHRVPENTKSPLDWNEDKPDRWVIGLTRGFDHRVEDGRVLFVSQPFKHTRTFGYDDTTDALTELHPRPATPVTQHPSQQARSATVTGGTSRDDRHDARTRRPVRRPPAA